MSAWLLIDTATPTAVVGIWREGRVLAEERLSETRKHAEGIIDALDRVLLIAGVGIDELAGVGVGRGPGSFIGVRTGIATAKGICLGRGIPLVGLPTLVALAASVELPAGRGLAVVDAKRGELYAQLVEVDGAQARVERAVSSSSSSAAPSAERVRAVEPAAPLSPADVTKRAAALAFVVGSAPDGAVTHPRFIALPAPTVAGLGRMLAARIAAGVIDETDALAPDYCRAPDAKLPAVDPSARRPPS